MEALMLKEQLETPVLSVRGNQDVNRQSPLSTLKHLAQSSSAELCVSMALEQVSSCLQMSFTCKCNYPIKPFAHVINILMKAFWVNVVNNWLLKRVTITILEDPNKCDENYESSPKILCIYTQRLHTISGDSPNAQSLLLDSLRGFLFPTTKC